MDSLTFFQNINSNIFSIISLLNLVLLVELTIAFILGMRLGFLTGEATTSKITERTRSLRCNAVWCVAVVAAGVGLVRRAASMCVCGVCWAVGWRLR